MLRRQQSSSTGAVCSRSSSAVAAAAISAVGQQVRGMKIFDSYKYDGVTTYATKAHYVAGRDASTKLSEFYDGGTDSMGVFKEGAPSVLRNEYLRSPEHRSADNTFHRPLWSPFEAPPDQITYSPLHSDYQHHNAQDKYGHRTGDYPGGPKISHYSKDQVRPEDIRFMINHYPMRNTPKWLALIVNDHKHKKMLGMFLYANGAYVCEFLTYKQLPRLVYNKPFQGCVPTIGQTVQLSEVTYGKEVHSLSFYPGSYGAVGRWDGSSSVVLRGTEPDLVPMLLPSKEIRLFDATSTAVFGRRAGVLREFSRVHGRQNGIEHKWRPTRPRLKMRNKHTDWWGKNIAAGHTGWKKGPVVRQDWKGHPYQMVKQKYWLNAYTLKSGKYTRYESFAELKGKTYSWASRDPVFRTERSEVV